MRKPAILLDGKSMWRWLLLATLLTGIVSQNFTEPRSVYRIEEVISASEKAAVSGQADTFFSLQKTDQQTVHSHQYRLQCERLRFLSLCNQINAELAISNAPDLLHILMRATGQHLKSRSQSPEEPFHLLS